ncbi:MAG: DUF1566 domain-containing protein [Polyangiaceae bacterium]|jgi:hypothetical protein
MMVSRFERWTVGVGLAFALVTASVVATRPSRAFAPPGRFTVGTGTVIDTQTKLTWQAVPATTTSTWSAATSYCQNLALGGSSGWRLPSVGELQTLVDDSRMAPATDPTAFPSTPIDVGFWTSSSVAGFGSTYGWAVSFRDGSSIFHFASDSLHMRCVTSSL